MIFRKGEFVWLPSGVAGKVHTVRSLENDHPFEVISIIDGKKYVGQYSHNELKIIDGWELQYEQQCFFNALKMC